MRYHYVFSFDDSQQGKIAWLLYRKMSEKEKSDVFTAPTAWQTPIFFMPPGITLEIMNSLPLREKLQKRYGRNERKNNSKAPANRHRKAQNRAHVHTMSKRINQALNFEQAGVISCIKCNRLLREEKSRERGMGPVCYKGAIKDLQKGFVFK